MTTEHQIKFKDFLSSCLCAYIGVISVNLSNRVDRITLSKSFLRNSELSCNGLYWTVHVAATCPWPQMEFLMMMSTY